MKEYLALFLGLAAGWARGCLGARLGTLFQGRTLENMCVFQVLLPARVLWTAPGAGCQPAGQEVTPISPHSFVMARPLARLGLARFGPGQKNIKKQLVFGVYVRQSPRRPNYEGPGRERILNDK